MQADSRELRGTRRDALRPGRVLPLALLLVLAAPAAAQTAYVRTAAGNWSNADAWSPVGVPGPGDSADLNGRTVTLDVDANVATLVLPDAASFLQGTGDLTITAVLDWQGGRLEGAGTTLIAAGATLSISGDASKGVRFGRIVRNEGSGTWSGSGAFSNGGDAMLVNAGTLTITAGRADGSALFFGDTFTNTGSLIVDSTSIANFSSFFHNQGTVAVNGGTLRLRGFNSDGGTDTGTYDVADGALLAFAGGSRTMTASASVSGAGTVEVQGGSTTLAGNYDVHSTRFVAGTFALDGPAAMNSLEMLSGTFRGSGAVSVTDAFTWAGGNMRGSGTTTVGPAVDVAIDGATVALSDTRTLVLQGSTTWSGAVSISNGSSGVTLVNAGSFTSNGAGERTYFAGTFRNEGSFVHAEGTAAFASGFDNIGVVEVQAGTLRLSGFNATGGTDSGSYAIAPGARLHFSGGNRTLTSSALISGGGTVEHNFGALGNSATIAPGASPGILAWVAGSFVPLAGATLALEIAGTTPGSGHDLLAVDGNVTLGGALEVAFADGFVPAPADIFVIVTATGSISGDFVAMALPAGYALMHEPDAVVLVPQVIESQIFADGFESP